MALHVLKIDYEYAEQVLNGSKTFEIRKNDRNYQKNDLVVFGCRTSARVTEAFSKKVYQIGYLTDYNQKDDYVVFSIKELK